MTIYANPLAFVEHANNHIKQPHHKSFINPILRPRSRPRHSISRSRRASRRRCRRASPKEPHRTRARRRARSIQPSRRRAAIFKCVGDFGVIWSRCWKSRRPRRWSGRWSWSWWWWWSSSGCGRRWRSGSSLWSWGTREYWNRGRVAGGKEVSVGA